jgi:penicillin-binding protein 2
MAAVVSPGGTAGLSHLQGIDFAGKTGSAQTISNALKAKMGASGKKFKDNGWFAGVEPRRSPDIVVCALLEEGEHGYLAARAAAQVIKAYVEKQRRQPTKVAGSGNGKVEIGAVWGEPGVGEDGDSQLRTGRFFVDVARKRVPLAVAAPGLH